LLADQREIPEERARTDEHQALASPIQPHRPESRPGATIEEGDQQHHPRRKLGELPDLIPVLRDHQH
jgi:hypothetical protein